MSLQSSVCDDIIHILSQPFFIVYKIYDTIRKEALHTNTIFLVKLNNVLIYVGFQSINKFAFISSTRRPTINAKLKFDTSKYILVYRNEYQLICKVASFFVIVYICNKKFLCSVTNAIISFFYHNASIIVRRNKQEVAKH